MILYWERFKAAHLTEIRVNVHGQNLRLVAVYICCVYRRRLNSKAIALLSIFWRTVLEWSISINASLAFLVLKPRDILVPLSL